jgi:DNA-binding NarL/FixJ family response regulator
MLFKPINLAIVDDHALFRKMLKNYLSEQKNMHVVVQATDMMDLLYKMQNHAVDVLIMDLLMPGLHGGDAVKAMKSQCPDVKILILSMSDDLDVIIELLDAGIHGYISKTDEPEEMLQAIQAVSENRIYRSRLFTEALYRTRQHTITSNANESLVNLNDREKKILQLLWNEKSNKEIADELFLGIRSVEKIRQDIKEKIGVKSTVGLIKYAIRNKIIGFGAYSDQNVPQVYR